MKELVLAGCCLLGLSCEPKAAPEQKLAAPVGASTASAARAVDAAARSASG